MRFRRDGSWQRFDCVVIAGSPLKIFRTTEAGAQVIDAIETDHDVTASGLVDRLLEAGAIHPTFDANAFGTFGIDDVTVVTPQLGGCFVAPDRFVVDDGSVPPLKGADLRLDINSGPAAARNAARPHITTPIVAFVDADVDLLRNVGIGSWLDALLPHFDDPRVGLVAPQVAGEEGSPIDLGTEPARVRAGTRVSYVPGAAIVVRIAAFDDIGGFDEALRFGEDVDFVWRLDQSGWHCRYEPASAVWHEPRAGIVARMRQNAGYGTSAAALALRHPNALSPLHTNGWTASAYGAAAAGHPLVGASIALGSAAALIPKLPDLPARSSFELAMRGHLYAVRQFASAVRRVWWPPVLLAALVSKRVRWLTVASIAVDVAATPNDVAYGWGVWKGMLRHRTWLPIIPRFNPWPGRSSDRQ